MEFTLRIEKKWVSPIRFVISYRSLNIKVLSVAQIPGVSTSGDPDTEVRLKLLSEDPGEIFFLGFYAGQERLSIELH